MDNLRLNSCGTANTRLTSHGLNVSGISRPNACTDEHCFALNQSQKPEAGTLTAYYLALS